MDDYSMTSISWILPVLGWVFGRAPTPEERKKKERKKETERWTG